MTILVIIAQNVARDTDTVTTNVARNTTNVAR